MKNIENSKTWNLVISVIDKVIAQNISTKENKDIIIAIGGCMMQEEHITEKIKTHPNIEVVQGEVKEPSTDVPLIVATGPLAQAVVMLATAPKSNSAYLAYDAAAADVRSGKGMKMPDYLRDSMQPAADKNKAYVYPHPYPKHYYIQQYLPDDHLNAHYYTPSEQGHEAKLKPRK